MTDVNVMTERKQIHKKNTSWAHFALYFFILSICQVNDRVYARARLKVVERRACVGKFHDLGLLHTACSLVGPVYP